MSAAAFNLTIIRGVLSRPTEAVPLAGGSVLVRYEITVPTADPDGRAVTVPATAVDPHLNVRELDGGTELLIIGRTRRRFWSAAGATRSQVDVLADTVVLADQDVVVGQALTEAAARLARFTKEVAA